MYHSDRWKEENKDNQSETNVTVAFLPTGADMSQCVTDNCKIYNTKCIQQHHFCWNCYRNIMWIQGINQSYVCWWFIFNWEFMPRSFCWWTSESPRAHVAEFYCRIRLIRSVWRESKFSVFKIDWNCNFVGLLHHPFWLQLVLALFGHYFSTFSCYMFG